MGEAAVDVTGEDIQIHGGVGFTWDGDAHFPSSGPSRRRDARQQRLAPPAARRPRSSPGLTVTPRPAGEARSHRPPRRSSTAVRRGGSGDRPRHDRGGDRRVPAARGRSRHPAFYRHFDSKDDFLVATWLRQTQAAVERLEARLARTRSSRRAVEVWIDDFLDRLYADDGTPHVEALWRNGFWLRNAYPTEYLSIVRLQVDALRRILIAGRAAGELPATDPTMDADTILATCWMLPSWPCAAIPSPARAARRHLLRVVRGLTGAPATGTAARA